MREYLLLRHGQTDWNTADRIQGEIDVPLNENGRRQARQIAENLEAERIDYIFSSPLARALDTAREVARPHGLEVLIDRRLIELSQGRWNGKLVSELKKESAQYRKWSEDPAGRTPPGGESLGDVFKRVREFLVDQTKGLEGKTAIVSHKVVGAMIRIILESAVRNGKPVADVRENEVEKDFSKIWDILASNVEVCRIKLG